MCDGNDITDILINDGQEVKDTALTEFPFTKCIIIKKWRMIDVPEDIKECNNAEDSKTSPDNIWNYITEESSVNHL